MEETLTEKQQYFRQYYQDNKDKYRVTANEYYHKNRERMMKYYREYYAQWYEANKDWVNAHVVRGDINYALQVSIGISPQVSSAIN